MKHRVWSVLSYGGGTQTMAMGRMIINGDLPRPDLVIFADTHRERKATYRIIDQEFARLNNIGVEAVIVTGGDLGLAMNSKAPMTPLFTVNADGSHGQMHSVCSERFKTRIVRREMRRRGMKKAEVWLGLTTDEIERMKPSPVQWIETRWPLIDMGIRRADCEAYLQRDKATPVKSACIMCPHTRTPRYLRLDDEERDFAITYDEAIRHSRSHEGVTCYVSDERRPLREVLDAARRQTDFIDMLEISEQAECSGSCFG